MANPAFDDTRRPDGSRTVTNTPTASNNEVYVDRDIMVLANPEIAQLPGWVIALVAAGSLAAALSTAAGLLLVISTSISHDLLKQTMAKGLTDRQELLCPRCCSYRYFDRWLSGYRSAGFCCPGGGLRIWAGCGLAVSSDPAWHI